MKLNENFIDGQITCPISECGQIFFARGQIGGRLRWVPSHGNCQGAGKMVPLEQLTDPDAIEQGKEYHRLAKKH